MRTEGDALGQVRVPPAGLLDLYLLAEPSTLAALRPDDLHALYIEPSDFTDATVVHLLGLSALEVLGLADTLIGDVGVEFLLRRLPRLRSLDLARTRVTDLAMESIGQQRSLESLNLWGTSVTDIGLEKLRRLADLRHLVLHGTQVTGHGMTHVRRLRNLTALDVWGLPITDRDVGPLRMLQELRELDLWRALITARGLAKPESLPHWRVWFSAARR
jgi:hypothetical protein